MCRLNDCFENGRGLSATAFKSHWPIVLSETIGRAEAGVLVGYLSFEEESYPFALALPSDFLGLALPLLQEAVLEVQPGRGLGKLLAALVSAPPETVSCELAKVKL